ncbi:hypothetical protein ACJX0J_029130, partial [Zea mays]
ISKVHFTSRNISLKDRYKEQTQKYATADNIKIHYSTEKYIFKKYAMAILFFRTTTEHIKCVTCYQE